jgi:hypothetical protein
MGTSKQLSNQQEPQPQQPIDPNVGEPGQGGANDIFRVDSSVFRIYGDGMLEDTLVRASAVVWRSPFNQADTAGGGTNDPFRIIDWKVIQ